ncbi:hypothetical protein F5Y16DRAFT_389896 [Xylariaceae sp. FL0255]|nr:hypothetical protein F5Y16DRAFT_389896 [Xylariaceae sp. FL0255]
MYDDYDHDHHSYRRQRSPPAPSRDHHHRHPRHDGSRSPRRSPPPRAHRGHHRYRDERDDDDQESFSRRPGRPHHTLKLDRLPDWMSSQDVDDFLHDMGAKGLVDVRIKSDDRARCYGFAEFRYEDDAVDFLETHYPALTLTDRNTSSSTRIYIDYSRERRPPPAAVDDWRCTLCHFDNFSRRTTCKQCKAPRASENAADMHLDGQSDECPQQTPSQFVVIRGLASSANETILAAGVKKLYLSKDDELKQSSSTPAKLKSTAPIGNTQGLGARLGSLVRVFIVREKLSDISCNYGFAEFSTLEDTKAAVAKYSAHPQFTISSKPVTVAFIHSGVFIPYLHPISEQDRSFTFSATHNPSLRLSYWNPSVYVRELLTFDESLYEDKSQQHPSTQAQPESDAPTGKDSKKRKAEKDLTAPSGKKAIAMAPQLQMWAHKHAELHKSEPQGDGPASHNDQASVTGSGSNLAARLISSSAALPPSVSYADLDRMCCLLCRRKFKNEHSLRRHENSSDMHKSSLADDTLILRATQDLKARGKEPTQIYRDRAKERRMAHKQLVKPKPQATRKNRDNEQVEENPTKPAMSKGAGLLAKMGWSKGEGLGAEAGGRTSIIETTAYLPGVGLGAEGGKLGDAAQEAAHSTRNDYSDFVSRTKDKAKERYERMS